MSPLITHRVGLVQDLDAEPRRVAGVAQQRVHGGGTLRVAVARDAHQDSAPPRSQVALALALAATAASRTYAIIATLLRRRG
jgi:hypothetical protein|eukprot:COSAG01_NODE_35663_length_528_cov_2.440559_1_plen_82_part_00